MMLRTAWLGAAACLPVFFIAGPALGQGAPSTFNLGKIETVTVTGSFAAALPMSAGVVDNETSYTLHQTSLDHAINTLAGVAASNSGGSRNEQLVFVHGFDRFQVPLSIDGIRVYLPADNRLDFGRFLTADLSEIQVAKGYVSVLNGPGALGGAINLVTRKPVSALDFEARSGLELGNSGSLDTTDASFSVGTKQDSFYLEASTAWTERARFELSDDYTPTATENGGFRDHSRTRDWSLHLKAGYTPNDTDEYSISYIKQTSGKDAPFSVSDTIASQRDWTWPYWDIDSLYFLSSTALGENAYVKTKLYYNTFTNGLFSYDNANYNTQSLPKAFRSYYDDYAYGGSVEAGMELFAGDTLKGSFFYRRDDHDEQQVIYAPAFTEPHQITVEDTYSLAAENTWHATDELSVIAGVSYDWRHLLKAQDFVDPTTAAGTGTFVNYPLNDGSALNAQGALIYTASPDSTYYFNVSDRTRFPTIFERFSTRFNSAASNPGLNAERAANVEIGTRQSIGGLFFDGAAFYNDVSNAIASVILPSPAPANTTQSQNVGHGTYMGVEVSLRGKWSDSVDLGVNYTYQIRNIRTPANVAPLRLTGDPLHKAYAYLSWAALPELTVTPNLDWASKRWTVTTNGLTYFKTGAYIQAGVSADWQVAEHFDINAGVKNLTDKNYQLTAGFPEPGRTYFMALRYRQ